MLSRRSLIVATPAALLAGAMPALAAAATFYRNPGCGCCHIWAEKMRIAGFVLDLVDTEDLAAEQAKLGVPESIQGCHAGMLDGYVLSGHVPPGDVKRLLAERPKARGLAVGGMPAGSPGMESAGSEPYSVMLFQADGTATEYARHG